MSYAMNENARAAVARWCDPAYRLAKGELFQQYPDVHADILIHAYSTSDPSAVTAGAFAVGDLNEITQFEADFEVADALGSSITHAILLRHIHDGGMNARAALESPEELIGAYAPTLLSFWRYLDQMTPEAWAKTIASIGGRDQPLRARRAWAHFDQWSAHHVLDAWETCAARDVGLERTGRTAWNGRRIAFAAMAEIAGARWLPAHKRGELVFLPMFDFSSESVGSAPGEVA